ncbi:hypothetical protein GQ53DRAFT_825792 [Thozetella sp. PMI_491]|nr:hypothetical protein GQ53DRAFT_825792 [Thozetella sp. PMI_491]
MLHSKSKSGSTEAEKWYEIWRILFESDPSPRSPYIDLELSEDLCSFKEVLDNRGPAVLWEQLERHGISLPPPEGQDSLLRNVWSEAIQLIEEDWRVSRSSSLAHPSLAAQSSTTGSGSRPSPSSRTVETSLASIADSGVVLLRMSDDSWNSGLQPRAGNSETFVAVQTGASEMEPMFGTETLWNLPEQNATSLDFGPDLEQEASWLLEPALLPLDWGHSWQLASGASEEENPDSLIRITGTGTDEMPTAED